MTNWFPAYRKASHSIDQVFQVTDHLTQCRGDCGGPSVALSLCILAHDECEQSNVEQRPQILKMCPGVVVFTWLHTAQVVVT